MSGEKREEFFDEVKPVENYNGAHFPVNTAEVTRELKNVLDDQGNGKRRRGYKKDMKVYKVSDGFGGDDSDFDMGRYSVSDGIASKDDEDEYED